MARLFVEQLTVIDCARLDAESGLVGESWIVDLELEGELDEQGMVLDFGAVKPLVKEAVDDSVDHRLLVPAVAPGLRLAQGPDGDPRLEYAYAGGLLRHRSPQDALCVIDAAVVDHGAVTRHLEALLAPLMPPNVTAARLGLRQEAIFGPSYRYAHGLKKHGGNCQRIAHGHRSRIRVWRDDEQDAEAERWIAERWRDVYLGTREDVVEQLELAGRRCLRFAYTAPQGEFELVLDAARCELLETESTVENIAAHLAGLLARRDPGGRYRVRAYEGVGKGAVAETAATGP